MTGLWGLQAVAANTLDNIEYRQFRDAMQLAAARATRGEDQSEAVIDAIIACMRYANALGINVDDLATSKIKRNRGKP